MFLIGQKDLQPGLWVTFSGENAVRYPPPKTKTTKCDESEKTSEPLMISLFPKIGPFKVISREDGWGDSCRCYLMNLDGKLIDYRPSFFRLMDEEMSITALPVDYKVYGYVTSKLVKELKGKEEEILAKIKEAMKLPKCRGKLCDESL